MDKLGAPVNKLSNKLGSEAFWPTTLDKESDKAARILKSFCSEHKANIWFLGVVAATDTFAQKMVSTPRKTLNPPTGRNRSRRLSRRYPRR